MKETVYYFGAQRKERESLQKAIMQKIFQPGERYGHPHSQDSKNFKEVECYELWKYTHNIQTFSCFNQDKKAKSQMNERRVSIKETTEIQRIPILLWKKKYIYIPTNWIIWKTTWNTWTNFQSNLDTELSWRHHTSWFQLLLQNYSNQNTAIKTDRVME